MKPGLRERAERRGKSMENEAREIPGALVIPTTPPVTNLGTAIAARFAGIGLDAPIDELCEAAKPDRVGDR
jgi:plasmid stability protein